MTTDLPRWRHCDVVNYDYHQEKPYRLWRGPPITAGKHIIILVHGAVVPLLGKLHDLTKINNDRYGFYDLDSLLYHDFHYNVFTFEYADIPIISPTGNVLGYVNYGDLIEYGKRLIEAIGFAKEKSKMQDGVVGPVTIIAHSMGGLVARCAAKIAAGTISKIITLDTGHCGFGLANFVDNILKSAGVALPSGISCSKEVEERSDLIKNLYSVFNPDNPKLVSLAATEPVDIPSLVGVPPPPVPIQITVVGLHSSSMMQVYDNGQPTTINYKIPFYPLHYSHVTITQITSDNCQAHEAYQKIKESLQ